MTSQAKKTKLDSETRNFNDDCTLKCLFILLTLHNSKPMCLLWNECVLAVKEYNLMQHFTTKQGFCTRKVWLLKIKGWIMLYLKLKR